MTRFKGIIALDIDGTITVEKHHLEPSVLDYLNNLIKKGWVLIFITGRTFSFAWPILSDLEGEYFFATQNGAALYECPSKKCIVKHFLKTDSLSKIDPLFELIPGGLLVESGKENGDICYYKPHDFNSEELEYIDFRIGISPESWKSVSSFEELPFSEFAVGKFFATEEKAHELSKQLANVAPLNVVVIRDPFRPGYHLAHVNAKHASKGLILKEFASNYSALPIIGAGDDYNDVEMLENSTIKIVMQNAPERLHQLADIVAPGADVQGIIEGLEKAIWKV